MISLCGLTQIFRFFITFILKINSLNILNRLKTILSIVFFNFFILGFLMVFNLTFSILFFSLFISVSSISEDDDELLPLESCKMDFSNKKLRDIFELLWNYFYLLNKFAYDGPYDGSNKIDLNNVEYKKEIKKLNSNRKKIEHDAGCNGSCKAPFFPVLSSEESAYFCFDSLIYEIECNIGLIKNKRIGKVSFNDHVLLKDFIPAFEGGQDLCEMISNLFVCNRTLGGQNQSSDIDQKEFEFEEIRENKNHKKDQFNIKLPQHYLKFLSKFIGTAVSESSEIEPYCKPMDKSNNRKRKHDEDDDKNNGSFTKRPSRFLAY